MDITYDSSKDLLNMAKHDVSLREAKNLDWETLTERPDTRQNYGEQRFIGYGLIGQRLYCVVFTDRDNQRRIISLRKANDREKIYYETQIH